MMGLSDRERISMIRSAVLIQITCVTDRWTDGQMELAWHIRAIAYMLLRVKTGTNLLSRHKWMNEKEYVYQLRQYCCKIGLKIPGDYGNNDKTRGPTIHSVIHSSKINSSHSVPSECKRMLLGYLLHVIVVDECRSWSFNCPVCCVCYQCSFGYRNCGSAGGSRVTFSQQWDDPTEPWNPREVHRCVELG